MPFTIAIDGPAASGKGTIARALAQRFGFLHLDTGLLYRAVGAMGGDPARDGRHLLQRLREGGFGAEGVVRPDHGAAPPPPTPPRAPPRPAFPPPNTRWPPRASR